MGRAEILGIAFRTQNPTHVGLFPASLILPNIYVYMWKAEGSDINAPFVSIQPSCAESLLSAGHWNVAFTGPRVLKKHGCGGWEQGGVTGQVTETEFCLKSRESCTGSSLLVGGFCLLPPPIPPPQENQKGPICLAGKGHGWWLVTSGGGATSFCHPEYQSSLGVGNQGRKKGFKKKKKKPRCQSGSSLSAVCRLLLPTRYN